MDDLFDGLEPIPDEGISPHRAEPEKPEPEKPAEGSPILARIQDTRPRRLDGGRTLARGTLPPPPGPAASVTPLSSTVPSA